MISNAARSKSIYVYMFVSYIMICFFADLQKKVEIKNICIRKLFILTIVVFALFWIKPNVLQHIFV